MQKRVLAAFVIPMTAASFMLASTSMLRAQEGEELRSLLDELEEQIERAERERVADPWFIEELRSLHQRYDEPWQELVYDADFLAGDLREVPSPWQVMAGRVDIDWNRGLRSTAQPTPGEERRGPIAQELLGSILEEAFRRETIQEERRDAAGPARYYLPASISNAFDIQINMTQRPPQDATGRYALSVFQGRPEGHSYSLDVTTSTQDEVAFALVRRSPDGEAETIETSGEHRLQATEEHELRWTRDRAGRMVVMVDGETALEAQDDGLQDRWNGFAVTNAGGDLAFAQIEIHGTP